MHSVCPRHVLHCQRTSSGFNPVPSRPSALQTEGEAECTATDGPTKSMLDDASRSPSRHCHTFSLHYHHHQLFILYLTACPSTFIIVPIQPVQYSTASMPGIATARFSAAIYTILQNPRITFRAPHLVTECSKGVTVGSWRCLSLGSCSTRQVDDMYGCRLQGSGRSIFRVVCRWLKACDTHQPTAQKPK